MKLAEQIAKLKLSIKSHQDKIVAKSGESISKGVTPDESTEAEIKKLQDEIDVMQKNLTRLENIAKNQQEWGESTPAKGDTSQDGLDSTQGKKIEVVSNLPKGFGFAQYARSKFISALEAKKGNYITPLEAAKQMNFNDEVQALVEKATVGTTTDASFAAALVRENKLVGEFVDMLKAATVFDKLKGMRDVPFNTTIPSKTKRGTATWVGEGAKKQLTNPEFGEVKIKEHKLAGITVYTQELMRRADPAVDALVRDDLIEAAQILIDETFLGAQAETDTTPIGIFNSVVAVPSSGTTAANYDADLQALEDKFLEANLSLDGSYYVMSETRAARMGRLRDALGNYYYSGMQGTNKELSGRPVVTSETVGEKIGLIKTSELLLAQDGGVDVSYSDQATLTNTDGTIINLWQENKFAVRVEKFITWAKRRPVAAAFIDYTPVGG